MQGECCQAVLEGLKDCVWAVSASIDCGVHSFDKRFSVTFASVPMLIITRRSLPLLFFTQRGAKERIHQEIWRRFVTRHGVLLDYTGLDGRVPLPSAEEYASGKPNALAWWTPTENGAMFTGLYLTGLLKQYAAAPTGDLAAKIRRLAGGLERLALVSAMAGFAARGLTADGKHCPLLSSTDQFFPWFLGLWRFWRSPLASSADRRRVARLLLRAMNGLRANQYRVPTPASLGDGELGLGLDGFLPLDNEQAPRLLLLLRATYEVTEDGTWLDLYREHLKERLLHLQRGWTEQELARNAWTSISPCLALEALLDLEQERSCREGLRASARSAARKLAREFERPVDYSLHFELDWRKMNELWRPQRTKQEARAVAQAQHKLLDRLSPRWAEERNHVGEPLHLAWMVSLAPEPDDRKLLSETLTRLQYDQLYVVRFFAAECVRL
jgi:hypothetical protein